MAYESPGEGSDARIFCGLLDGHFDAGRPRRHDPGAGSGEEEVLLQPPDAVLDFILGPPPEMVRAVRPKLDNFRPVRQRTPDEIVGHRLEIRQIFGQDQSGSVSTTYFIYTAEDLRINAPAKLRLRKEGDEDFQSVRHQLPTGQTGFTFTETFIEDLGPLRSYRHDKELSVDEITDLLRFIGDCAWREPREFE